MHPYQKRITLFTRKHHSQDSIFGLTLAGVSSSICHTLPLRPEISWSLLSISIKNRSGEGIQKSIHPLNHPTYSKDDRGAKNPHGIPKLAQVDGWDRTVGSFDPGDGTGYLLLRRKNGWGKNGIPKT